MLIAILGLMSLIWSPVTYAEVSKPPDVAVEYVTNVCADDIGYTSARGPAKLAMDVQKTLAIEVNTSVDVDAEIISAGVGFKVTESVTVVDKIEIDLPVGQFGEIYAMVYWEITHFGLVSGSRAVEGNVRKPIGVCFAPRIEE